MGFKSMRLKKQELSKDDTLNILKNAKQGVLSLNGDNGYPYAIPVNYAYEDGKIYFHGALKGSKLECILNNPKVCFSVVGKDDVVKEEYTTYFTSAICFGKAKILETEADKRKGLWAICNKYMPELKDESEAKMTNEISIVSVVAIEIEHMSGKIASELL